MRIIQNTEGNFETGYSDYLLEVHCLPFRPKGYLVDGMETKLPPRYKFRSLTFIVPKNFRRIEIY